MSPFSFKRIATSFLLVILTSNKDKIVISYLLLANYVYKLYNTVNQNETVIGRFS